jgi:oligogalacturonide lyase
MGSGRGFSRRSLLTSGLASGWTAARLLAAGAKGAAFPSQAYRYSDPATEFDVYRLTDPAYTSVLPAYYNRFIARNSGWMLFGCDRSGSLQAFRVDLKTGAMRQWTEAADLDSSSLTLTPDNRSFCYFAGRSLFSASVANLRERELYRIADGWERCPGLSVGPDGTHATFAERRGETSRLRMVPFAQGVVRTVVEAPFAMSDPIARPMRAQILYRQQDTALWLVNMDGSQNHALKTADGRVGPANWAPDGKTLLYLNFPDDRTQLNTIREYTPDTSTDKLVAKTSQFVAFGFNRDTSVFTGASGNMGSPYLLLLLRVPRRELTLCEHKSSHPETVAPQFTPDSQRVYFQSDRDGKPALYGMHVERLVEKTETEEKDK